MNIHRNMTKKVDLTLTLGDLGWPWPVTLTFLVAVHWHKANVFCLKFIWSILAEIWSKMQIWPWPWVTLRDLDLDPILFNSLRQILWLMFGVNTVDIWGKIVKNVNLTLTLNDLDLDLERKSFTSWTLYFLFGVNRTNIRWVMTISLKTHFDLWWPWPLTSQKQ